MIFDKENCFCFNTSGAVVAQGATVLGDVIDLWGGQSGATIVPPTGGPITNLRDIFAGNQAEFFMQVTTAWAQSANTCTLALTIADAAALTGNPITLWTSGTVTVNSTWVEGYRMRVPIKFPPIVGRQRYIGLLYTVTTTTVTAGALTAGLVWNTTSGPGNFV
jgi:uncharacterized protein YukE